MIFGSFLSLLLIIIAGWIGGQIATNIDVNILDFEKIVELIRFFKISLV